MKRSVIYEVSEWFSSFDDEYSEPWTIKWTEGNDTAEILAPFSSIEFDRLDFSPYFVENALNALQRMLTNYVAEMGLQPV